jgi:ATP-dependent Zn protease
VERLFDEALLLALRDEHTEMSMYDIRRARRAIELGLPEPTEYTPEEADMIATHEAGHATLAYLVGKGRKLEVLTIVKHKDALGFLAHSDTEKRHLMRASEMIAHIQIAMGGMVAEELFFGESTSGPGGDLVAATQMAVQMVGAYGLGGSLVSYQALDTGAIGGNLATKVLTDETGRIAVDTILAEHKLTASRLLGENRHIVEALRDALLERGELIDDQIIEVIQGAEELYREEGGDITVVDLRADKPTIRHPMTEFDATEVSK